MTGMTGITGIKGASRRTEGLGLMAYDGQVLVGRSGDEDDTAWSCTGARGSAGVRESMGEFRGGGRCDGH
ncbi:hypothetical protein SUDANB145_02940 [Streptomyces sp. enrichment culture]